MDYLRKFFRFPIYPRVIAQSKFFHPPVRFEVSSELEEWRAVTLDDEAEFLGRFLRNLNPDDCFYDIGACIGVYALHAARLCKQVYAFEPDPVLARHLRRNIQINGLNNVHVIESAITDLEGEIELHTSGFSGSSPNTWNRNHMQSIIVAANNLDHLVYKSGFFPPTILKIDIEGSEVLALSGARKLLSSLPRPRAIFLEVHPEFLRHLGHSPEMVNIFMESLGYLVIHQNIRDSENQVLYISGEAYDRSDFK